MPPLRRSLSSLLCYLRLLIGEGRNTSLESRRQVDVLGNNTPIEQAEHAIFDVILCNRWWLSKRIISEILWQDPLWMEELVGSPAADTKFIKFNVANATLRATVLELIRLRQGVLLSEIHVPSLILRVPSEIAELLLVHQDFHWFANDIELFRNRWLVQVLLLLEHGQGSAPFGDFREDAFVVHSNVFVHLALKPGQLILKLRQRCRWRLPLRERCQVLDLVLEATDVVTHFLHDLVDG